MGRGPHPQMYLVMALIRDGVTPAEAARQVKVPTSTVYRSKLYREWKNENKRKS